MQQNTNNVDNCLCSQQHMHTTEHSALAQELTAGLPQSCKLVHFARPRGAARDAGTGACSPPALLVEVLFGLALGRFLSRPLAGVLLVLLLVLLLLLTHHSMSSKFCEQREGGIHNLHGCARRTQRWGQSCAAFGATWGACAGVHNSPSSLWHSPHRRHTRRRPGSLCRGHCSPQGA